MARFNIFVLLLGVIFLSPAAVHAQDNNKDDDSNNPTSITNSKIPLWEAELPGGNYLVDLRRVSMVAMHKYQVDATMEVFEVTVDAEGSSLGRFYYVSQSGLKSPIGVGQSLLETMQERASMIAERTGQEEVLENTVMKSYPTTTHARTVEYRVGNLEQLDDLYRSIRRSWLLQRRGKFRIVEKEDE